jgi:protein TonB
VEEKPAPPEQRNKFDKYDRPGKKDRDNKTAESVKPAAPAPAAKAPATPAPPASAPKVSAPAAAPATPAKTPEKAPEKVVEKVVEKTPEKTPEKAAFETPPETQKSGKGMKLVMAATATIALFVALFVYPGLLRHSTKTPVTGQGDSSPLQLHVERSNGELLLTWNRDSDAIRNATKATLLITDGEQHENVDIDLSQLRNNGSIVYSPSSADVSFKMEVIGRDQSKTTSEQVRILRTRPSPLESQQADAKAPAQAPTTLAAAVPTPATPDKKASNDKPATTTPAEEQPVAEAPKPVTPRKEFNTASLAQRIRPALATDIPDAPLVGGPVSAALPGVNLPSADAVPSTPIAPPQVSRPTPPPPTPAPSANPGNGKQGGQIQQAVLISRKEPEYPKIAKQTGAKGIVVLNATIGKDGRIKSVKVVSGHPMLQNAAIEAVKQWVYKPTLLNGTPVETETQVQLNFLGER